MLALVSLFGFPRSQGGLCLVIIAPKRHCWQHSFLGLPIVQYLKEISSGWLQLFYSNSSLPRHMYTKTIDGDLCISADGDILVKVPSISEQYAKTLLFVYHLASVRLFMLALCHIQYYVLLLMFVLYRLCFIGTFAFYANATNT